MKLINNCCRVCRVAYWYVSTSKTSLKYALRFALLIWPAVTGHVCQHRPCSMHQTVVCMYGSRLTNQQGSPIQTGNQQGLHNRATAGTQACLPSHYLVQLCIQPTLLALHAHQPAGILRCSAHLRQERKTSSAGLY